jgi:outer membrane lipoprotein-sorting protein
VVVNADKQQISEITIHDKNGGMIHYKIDEFTPNVEVGDDDFTFNPDDHPELEIVDMR